MNNNKTMKSRKAKGNYRKSNQQRCKENFPQEKKGYDNDPSWYSSNGKLLASAGQFNFTYPIGSTLVDFVPYSGIDAKLPGLLTLLTMPSVGNCKDASSPLNIAMNAQYSFIRHANSGHANYDAPDLMLYTLAMSNVYSYINFLTRVYGTVGIYTQRNRYFPKTVLTAQGVNPDDAMIHRMDLYNGILLLIQKAASFYVPGNMNIFKREAFMYEGIYTEGTSIKDQMYAFVPYGFYQYSLGTNPAAGCLKLKKYHRYAGTAESLYTVEELIQFGNELLEPLIGSEDIGIMSGDILKAYGENGVMKMGYPDFNYVVNPVFNITVLEQFKNAIVLGNVGAKEVDTEAAGLDDGTILVHQDVTSLKTGPFLKSVYVYVDSSKNNTIKIKARQNVVLTTTTADPGLDVVVENSRLMVQFDAPQDSEQVRYYELFCGSDVVIKGYVWSTDLLGNPWGFEIPSYFELTSSANLTDKMAVFAKMSTFDFKPLNWYIITDTMQFYLFGDIDNFALLSRNDMATLEEAVMVNLFNIPSLTIV